jgi:hypothetical protein
MPVSISGNTGITFPDGSLQTAAASPLVLRNRIINGAMVIDQRNAGASVANDTTGTQYSLDRWNIYGTSASKFTIQQNAGAVTTPVGFSNYLGATSSAATAVSGANTYLIVQNIEGYNIADLAWGTANAKTITISFQVYSSLTGTFGGALVNSAQNRSYPFTYTISTANTWTTISVTIAGDTSGTWLTTNGVGIRTIFSLGTGSSLSGTAGAWAGAQYYSATGATSVVGTSGATFYITGVQLEIGTSATPFERRLYNQELANCMRYFEKLIGNAYTALGAGYAYTTTATRYYVAWQVPKRTNATVTLSAANTFYTQGSGVDTNPSAVSVVGGPSTSSFLMAATGTYTAGAGFTILDNGTSATTIQISAEL